MVHVVDRRRHGGGRRGAFAAKVRAPHRPHLYRGIKNRDTFRDIYAAEQHSEGRYRWLISTCLAAAVGAVAILVVIFGSADPQEGSSGIVPALNRIRESVVAPSLEAALRRDEGLKWAVPRTDR